MDASQEADTFREWLALVEQDEPVEFIRGKIVRKAMPTLEHGGVQGAIFSQLFGHLSLLTGKSGWWLSQEVDLFIGGEGVRPDLVGWRRDRHPKAPQPQTSGPHKGVITEPPDWVCEVLSPSTASRDLGAKREAYHRARVGHYWVIDPYNEVLTIFRWSRREYGVVMTAGPEDGKIAGPPFAETEFDVDLLFKIVRQMRESQDAAPSAKEKKKRPATRRKPSKAT